MDDEVISEDSLPGPGCMTEIQANGEAILLTNLAGNVHAIGGKCPHAGAPLVQGVLHDGRVICPWHKAEFCARTGRMLAPPAIDDAGGYAMEQAGGEVRLRRLPERETCARNSSDHRCFVVIGAGAAGAMAVQTLREEGFAGRIVLIDSQGRVPYDRTVLSKYFLSGESGAEKTPLQTQAYYARHEIERVAAEVRSVDAPACRVICADGRDFPFDALLLAPGAVPVLPNLPGADLPGVYVLRSRAHADAILAQAERSARAIVLGCSFIGMEVAAALRERGLDVTVVGREAQPFEKQFGPDIGAAFVALHTEKGVAFRLCEEAAEIERDGEQVTVGLKSGDRISADLVVLGLGVRPATSFAASLPRNDDGSLTVDANLRVSDKIFAAGDIARFPLHGTGPFIRVEHWRVAQQQGRIAALNMLGRNERYVAAPVFWTIQYMQRLDYVGHAAAWDECLVHGDISKRDFLAYYIKDGVVIAAAGLGRDREMAALVGLFDGRRTWRASDLGESPSALLEP